MTTTTNTPLGRYQSATRASYWHLDSIAFAPSDDGWTTKLLLPWARDLILLDEIIEQAIRSSRRRAW
jgi:hypothetical protein